MEHTDPPETMDTNAIAADLALCDLIAACGSAAAKRKAAKQRRVIFAAIKAANASDGLGSLTDDELLAELF